MVVISAATVVAGEVGDISTGSGVVGGVSPGVAESRPASSNSVPEAGSESW